MLSQFIITADHKGSYFSARAHTHTHKHMFNRTQNTTVKMIFILIDEAVREPLLFYCAMFNLQLCFKVVYITLVKCGDRKTIWVSAEHLSYLHSSSCHSLGCIKK